MKLIIILFLIISSVKASPPTQNQDADASWFSSKIYEGISKLNSNSGCVIHSHDSWKNGAYAIWKHYRTKECYVIIRGTKLAFNNIDIFTDLNAAEIYDSELDVRVHNGVRLRTEFILGDIDDKLKVCKRDIIITGHSLGGSIAHYLFLKYVKRHYYDWGQKSKASRFKAVMFGAPQLVTRTNNYFLRNYENSNINWYKYENDFGPELIKTIKQCGSRFIFYSLFQGNVIISFAAFAIISSVSYGDYIPGHKYHLFKNGRKEEYRYNSNENRNIWQHIKSIYNYEAIVKNGWGYENPSYDPWDTVNCLRMDYLQLLDEGENSEQSENIEKKNISDDYLTNNDTYDNETLYIDTAECENVNDYDIEEKYQDIILYSRNNSNNLSYIIKRILDNEKEYEYVICNETGFSLRQCDGKCNCHEVLKNNRPNEITQCTSYQSDSAMNCIVDGVIKNIEYKSYFYLITQTKIDKYYLMDYFCNNQTILRGNFPNKSKNISISTILLLLFMFIF